jgi:hypothetical protein
MEKEKICMSCPVTVCFNEKEGRWKFPHDGDFGDIQIPIEECDKYLSMALLAVETDKYIVYIKKQQKKLKN